MKDKAFKLVGLDWKSYILGSMSSDFCENKYVLTYGLNKVTEKIKGSLGIMCFKTLGNTLDFKENMYLPGIILEVKGKKSLEQHNMISEELSERDLDCFYALKWSFNNIVYKLLSRRTGPGTVFFDEIMPVKIIRERRINHVGSII